MLDASIPRVVTTEADEPRETRILPRGNFLDETGPIVEPAIPAFLGKLDTGGRRATRLDLANWIVSPANPLTARVFVNRAWRQFFGTGLSKTLDDLGSQGEWPTHPELLDWLAAEFMRAIGAEARTLGREAPDRTIVMSHTYRQSSLGTPQTGRARSGQSAAGAAEPLPRGCGSGARHRARSLRPAGGEVRRARA